MTRFRLTISSGRGPIEARRFVAQLANALAELCATRGALVEHTTVHGSDAAPLSVDLTLEGAPSAFSDLLGTHALVLASSQRGKRDRKRWYVGLHQDLSEAIESEELKLHDVAFETCRASGAGGQHVNRTESAVRATHLPTGLSVRIESQRSQHQNKSQALDCLRKALARRDEAQRAHAKSSRRVQSIHLERGRPVATWRMQRDRLVRADP